MAIYNYETVSKDPAKQQEILAFLSGFDLSIDTLPIAKEKKPQFLEASDDMRKTLLFGKPITNEVILNEDKDTVSYTCDFDKMVERMRCRMVNLHRWSPEAFQQVMETVPNAKAFLEGVGMPEPGTAGYLFDTYSDDQVYTGGYLDVHKKEFTDVTDITVVAGAQAVMEATGGVENWRDVKVNEDEVIALQQKLQVDMDGLHGYLGDVIMDPKWGGANAAKALFDTDPKLLMDEVDKLYFRNVAPSYLNRFGADFPKYLRALENPQDETIDSTIRSKVSNPERLKKELIDMQLPMLVQSALAAEEPPKFNRYLDVWKEEQKHHQLYKDLVNGQPIKDTLELLAKGPKKVFDTLLPPAKSRIEALQSKLKKERDPGEKLRLTAEIIANRELSGAQRGGKGLNNRPDPAAVAARATELAAEMSKVYENDPRAMEQLAAQATSGHGGKMMEAYNKAAQQTREAAKPVTYIDYINKLDLETASIQDVARLVAATSLLITQEKGAQAIADPSQIDKMADTISKESSFRELMKDPKTLQNAKMGLGLPIIEQLDKKRHKKIEERDAQPELDAQAKLDAERLAKDAQDPTRAEKNQKFLSWLDKQVNIDTKRRANAEEYALDHPAVREEARRIAEKHGYTLDIPVTKQQPEKQQPEKQQPQAQNKGPEMNG